jgi:hypothetical protein
MTTITIQRIRVVLNLKTAKVPALLPQAKAIYNAFETNKTQLPTPPVPLATLLLQIQDLDTAEQATVTKTKGTVPVRNAKRTVLVTSLESLRMYVQSLCDANPEQAATIAAAASMFTAKVAVRDKPILQARQGPQSGIVLLIANATLLIGRGVRKKATFNWEMSADGGKTWTPLPSTPIATTIVTGLTPLTTYAFRVSVTVSKTVGEWSQAVTLLVR